MGSSMFGEAKAILVGLQLCHQRGIHIQELDSDSQVMVHSFNHAQQAPWSVHYIASKIFDLLPQNILIRHSYREGNAPAYFLAALAHGHKSFKLYDTLASLPIGCQS